MIWGAVGFSSQQEHVLDHRRKAFQGPEFDGINLQVMEGDPGEAIAPYAQKISAELILIPFHGRKDLSRLNHWQCGGAGGATSSLSGTDSPASIQLQSK